MVFLGMLEGEPSEHPEPIIYETLKSAKSTTTGFFQPAVVIGDKVQQGQEVGTVLDYFGNRVETIAAPISGTVMMVNQTPPIKSAESVVTIGAEVK